MAQITLGGDPVNTSGELPENGVAAPPFTLVGTDLAAFDQSDLDGKVLLNIFPSLDTGVCATSVREFNQRAAELDNASVVCVSADLPFAHKRFCAAEGIDNLKMGSTFRNSEFLSDYGVEMTDGKLAGLCARAVVVYDADGNVTYSELVNEIGQEPDYDAAIDALANA